MPSKYINIALFFLILQLSVLYTQQNPDSLLEKIRDIDISLNEPVNSEENLYLNTVSFQSFYDVLSPMGEWIQITKDDIDEDLSDGEGQSFSARSEDEVLFIWKPDTEKDWKPYSVGKWEYTDHGWLWVSGDNWGNSTYNYGRWWNSPKFGWVWLPGYTWAPAWVKFKVSNDDNYISWVALTPKAKWDSEKGITGDNYRYSNKASDWVVVDNMTFTGDISTSKLQPEVKVNSILSDSREITDIRTSEDMIITGGPDVNRIEEKTGKKMKRKRLRFGRDKGKTIIGNDDVTVFKEQFRKYDGKGNKESIDKPNKFKKSEKVKKQLRKRKGKKNQPIRPGRN